MREREVEADLGVAHTDGDGNGRVAHARQGSDAATQRRGGARRENKGKRKDVTRGRTRVRRRGRKREIEYR